MVRAIETAQFGTRPIIAVNTGARILISPNMFCNRAYLLYSKIAKLRIIVITRINAKNIECVFYRMDY